jgi:hypothetical protein
MLELIVPPDKVDSGGGVGFTNIWLWAENEEQAFERAEELLTEYGWTLVSRHEANRVDDDFAYDDEVAEIIDAVRSNPHHRRYGRFFTYLPQ